MRSFSALMLVRYTMVLLFLWFGIQQLINPSMWVSYLPEFTGYLPMPGEMLVQLNGWFEIICAGLLLLGCYTRFIAFILGIHLLGIAVTAGGAVGVRDAALGLCALSLCISGADAWTLDAYVQRKKSIKV